MVTVTARQAAKTRLRLNSNDSRVPTDERNTAWRMVELALEALSVSAEVEIEIEKRLPVQGGLGAGSANAVAALVGLEAEIAAKPELGVRSFPTFEQSALEGWGTRLRWPAQRLEIAAKVGSDMPLSLIPGTVLGLDRGQEVH